MKINSEKYTHTSGMYVSVEPDQDSLDRIQARVHSLNPPFPMEKFSEEAHMTVMYSRKETVDPDHLDLPETGIYGLCNGIDYWDGHNGKGFIVLRLIAKQASELHDHILDHGAEHSFKTYDPHMTLIDEAAQYDKSVVLEWIKTTKENLAKNPMIVHFDVLNIEDCKQD